MMTPTAKSQLKHSLLLALVFQIGWFVAAAIALLSGASVGIGLLVALIPVLWVPAALELLTHTKFPIVLQVNYYIFITLSSVAGSSFGVYALILDWDTWVHVYSGIILAWLGYYAVRIVEEKVKKSLPQWFTISAALATPLAFAALWEISEFLSDTFFHSATQAGGLEDTIVDMLAALVGAVVAIAIAKWTKLPKSLLPHSN